jgi:hypothetical protein
MAQEDIDLIDSMVDGYIQDITNYMMLDSESEAISMIRNSLKRLEVDYE